MSLQRSAVVHTSILASPEPVIAFLRDMEKWKSWAPWVRSVTRLSEGDWKLETKDGPMTVRFVEPNSFGVLDHRVTVASGLTVFNAMRVVPNGSGSELVMVVLQSSEMSAEQFEQDVQAVTDDFVRLKRSAEAHASSRS
jgi:polyketide cyclase/dehydrase/lipid transport protein